MAGRHFDGVELWDLSRVSRGARLADLGVARKGEVAMGLSAVSWGLGASIALAWLVTIPAAALISWVVYAVLHTAGLSG